MTRLRTSDRIAHLALLVILLLATILRAYSLDGQSLWADEGNSAAMVSRPWAQIAHASALDIHPPFYYWALKGWTSLFGASEAGLRSLSALLGVVLVWLTYQLGRQVASRSVALVAGLLACVNPLQIYYAQEARMYMLLAVCSAGLMWGMLRLVEQRRPRASLDRGGWGCTGLVIVLCSVLGLYTHYSFPIIIITANLLYLGSWIATARRNRDWKHLGVWIVLQAISLLLFLPWLPTALDRVRNWPSVAHPLAWRQALAAALRLLSLGPQCQAGPVEGWLAAFGLFLALGIGWPQPRAAEQRGDARVWLARLTPIAWLAAPVAMMLALRLFSEAYLKFLLVASAPFCVLLGRGLASLSEDARRLCEWLQKRTRRSTACPTQQAPEPIWRHAAGLLTSLGLLSTIAVPTAVALQEYFHDPLCARDDYRGIAEYLAAVGSSADAVILNAPGQSEVWSYYDRSGLAVYSLPEQRPLDVAATVSTLESLAEQHRTLYGLFWATEESDPQRVVETWLDQHTFKASDVWRGDVRFVTYATPDSATKPAVILFPDLSFGGQVLLREVRLLQDHARPGSIVQVLFLWQAETQLDRSYKVTVQLLDQGEQVTAQRDAEPAGESRPTTTWSPGETIADGHGLFIPWATAPGEYRMILALYGKSDGQRLRLPDGSDYAVLSEITVDRPDTPPPLSILPIRAYRQHDFGPVSLVGVDYYPKSLSYAPDTPLHPGDILHLILFWKADQQPSEDWSLALGLSGQPGASEAPLVSAQYPTSQWRQGEIVRGEHDLWLPADLKPGRYRVLQSLAPAGSASSDQLRLITIRVY